MPVRLGDIELRSVQDVRADDNRTLVELRAPGKAGSVFQDLGRAPASVVLEGLLVGEGASDTLDRLRSAYQKAAPLSFASDIAVGTDMTEIVIADLLVRQEAGYRERYRYMVKVREHVEPPENAAAVKAAVDAEVSAEAAAWTDASVAAADALADPASLPDALAARPELLDRMSADQLGDALGNNLSTLSGGKLGDVMDSVGALDPAKAGGALERLRGAGKLGAFVDKLVRVGRTILDVARKVGGILMDIGGVLDLLQAVKRVADAASALWADASGFWERWSNGAVWRAPAAEPFTVPTPTPRDVLLRVRELVAALAELVALEILKKLRDLARSYGLGDAIDAGARALIKALGLVQRVVAVLRVVAQATNAAWLVAELGARFEEVVLATEDLLDEATRDRAESTFRDLRWASTLLTGAPRPADVDALGAAFTALEQAFRFYTLGDVPAPAALPGGTT